MEFTDFKTAIQQQFNKMVKYELFIVGIDKDIMWEKYLDSFPPGTNEIFRERREYDCQHCKQFIRACGNVVTIIDGKTVSIWDIEIGEHFQVVADYMSALIKSLPVTNIFRSSQRNLGTDRNRQLTKANEVISWEHFYFKLPKEFVVKDELIGTFLSDTRSNYEVLRRSLMEITLEAGKTVLELIEQNSIYRGAEMKSTVELFIKLKKEFDESANKSNYCWVQSSILKGTSKIRNTAIGTLLTDISYDVPLDVAVAKFESKVAPQNYKRPTALVTKRMIETAQKKVQELGIESALKRRYAVSEDITINNVLFADRTAIKVMKNPFDQLIDEVAVNIKNFDKVEEVDIETFINLILPKADSVEILFKNEHINNLMSLIAPDDKESKNILKWDNNFSWSYNGEVTDSIKERVKKAGGNVNGVLRCSLSWFNYDDLDIHVKEPDFNHIYFQNAQKHHRSSGILDVDMNAGSGNTRNAVENIVWTNKNLMQEGTYQLFIHQYQAREAKDFGFVVEVEYGGVINTFHYDKKVRGEVPVATFEFSRANGIVFTTSLPSSHVVKKVWGISTNKFQKVLMIMNSPNHWDGNRTGNKHYFFIMEGCKNVEQSRGLYNEFLSEDLMDHRKVFEILGSKMKTEKSDNQLSGLGFSSTQKNNIICKVDGAFSRTIKINF